MLNRELKSTVRNLQKNFIFLQNDLLEFPNFLLFNPKNIILTIMVSSTFEQYEFLSLFLRLHCEIFFDEKARLFQITRQKCLSV